MHSKNNFLLAPKKNYIKLMNLQYNNSLILRLNSFLMIHFERASIRNCFKCFQLFGWASNAYIQFDLVYNFQGRYKAKQIFFDGGNIHFPHELSVFLND